MNHKDISPNLLENLPGAVVSAIRYLYENTSLKETTAFQLYYDVSSQDWVYLFAPTSQSFGRYIDRYVDLRNQQIQLIDSQSEFINLFQPSPEDELKFLISPFRELD